MCTHDTPPENSSENYCRKLGGLYNELFVNHYQGSDGSEISESAPQGSVSRAGFAQKSWGFAFPLQFISAGLNFTNRSRLRVECYDRFKRTLLSLQFAQPRSGNRA